MTTPENPLQDSFPYWSAATEATKKVTPGNELQEQASIDILALAFQLEVSKAFPDSDSSITE